MRLLKEGVAASRNAGIGTKVVISRVGSVWCFSDGG
jgi:hypothetical protein